MSSLFVFGLCCMYFIMVLFYALEGHWLKAWYWFGVIQITIAVEWGMG